MTDTLQLKPLHCSVLVLVCIVLVSGACSVNKVQSIANMYQFTPEVVAGTVFKHQVFLKPGKGRSLHVYLEGDGRPWLLRNRVARDPTPKNPLMLKLMAGDPAPAIYLGRPCYFKLQDPNCLPEWWAGKRYSAAVVQSLNSALQNFAQQYEGVILFGHSGGGTLAMLLAALRDDVVAVVTLAGNLDIDAWTLQHGYSRLRGSLNPATQVALQATILQQHYMGENDENINVNMWRTALSNQHAPQLYVLANVDHSCCWQPLWLGILQQLSEELVEQ